MAFFPKPIPWVQAALKSGLVIPAHPLALSKERKLDERRQRALSRYYHGAGAGGIAVGVHTTQFEIRSEEHRLFEPVLLLAHDTIQQCDQATHRSTVLIGGVCGRTPQALLEAKFLAENGFHAGLLSLAAFQKDDEKVVLAHCRTVAKQIPLMGFYLQPAVGGRILSAGFWSRFAEIPNVVAIKVAAFNRYHTLDVIRGVAESGRAREIALYTGNDDNIVADLVTPYLAKCGKEQVRIHFVGGLLGHWACWTKSAVRTFGECQAAVQKGTIPKSLLTLGAAVTDCNSAFFDADHNFAGCIAGIHEVLRRQKLLLNLTCLDPKQALSPGQKKEIDRVYQAYPDLNDNSFVAEHLDRWMSD